MNVPVFVATYRAQNAANISECKASPKKYPLWKVLTLPIWGPIYWAFWLIVLCMLLVIAPVWLLLRACRIRK